MTASVRLPLDRIASLGPGGLDARAHVVVRGLVTTSFDGSSFDAAMQWDGLTPGIARTGGLFDLSAGGLRVVEQRIEQHAYVLAPTGAPGPACAAAGIESPCFVPRLATIAHERLRTQAELTRTLSGGIELEGVAAPPEASALYSGLTVFVVVVAAAAAVGAAFAIARRRSRTPLGRVRSAGRAALRAVSGDLALAPLRTHVRSMLARAAQLDVARRACAARISRIDRAALDRKRDDCARSAAPEAADVLAWLTAEQAEAARLESDLASSTLGIERIESALRVLALRLREHRGASAAAGPGGDPVHLAAAELDLREEALREADRAFGP
jgi:hypothetical protein